MNRINHYSGKLLSELAQPCLSLIVIIYIGLGNFDKLDFWFFILTPFIIMQFLVCYFMYNSFEVDKNGIQIRNKYSFLKKKKYFKHTDIMGVKMMCVEKVMWGHPIITIRTLGGRSYNYHSLYLSSDDFNQMIIDLKSHDLKVEIRTASPFRND